MMYAYCSSLRELFTIYIHGLSLTRCTPERHIKQVNPLSFYFKVRNSFGRLSIAREAAPADLVGPSAPKVAIQELLS